MSVKTCFSSVWSCSHDFQLFIPYTTINDTYPDSQLSSRYHELRRILYSMCPGLLIRTLTGYLAYVLQPRFWLSAQVAAEERPNDDPGAA